MSIETRGLGAGSYPEPPDIEEDTGPRCACGETHNLREVDGVTMCRWCREDYYLDNCREDYWEFINASVADKFDFAVTRWFLTLEPQEQARVAVEAFQREFSSPFPQLQNLRDEIIRDYMEVSKSEFADFVENRAEIIIKKGVA